jgi:MtN3 and saliva related transmembrane protein
VPQVYQTWKTKQTKGLSLATLLMFFIACMFWLIYGLMRLAGPVIISNSVLGIMNLMLIIFKLKYK